MDLYSARVRFKLYLSAQGLVALATSAYMIALLYLTQARIPNEIANGVVGNLATVVGILVTFGLGARLDRTARRRLMIWANGIIAAIAWIPGFLKTQPPLILFCIVLGVDLVVTLMDEWGMSANAGYLKAVVSDDHIAQAQRGIQTVEMIAGMIGVVVVLVGLHHVHVSWMFYGASICYALVTMLLLVLPKDMPVLQTNRTVGWDDFVSAFRFVQASAPQITLATVGSGFILRNQIVMSLVVFYIGRIDPGLHHILRIALGMAAGMVAGLACNMVAKGTWVSPVTGVTGLISTVATFGLGVIGFFPVNPIVVGVVSGLIFGFGIVPSTLLHTLQVRHTPGEFQARMVILRHTVGGIGAFVLTIVLSAIAQYTKEWGIPFIVAGLVYLASYVLFMFRLPRLNEALEAPNESSSASP